MKKKDSPKTFSLILLPFCAAIPVLSITSSNIHEITLQEAVRSMIVALLCGLVVALLLKCVKLPTDQQLICGWWFIFLFSSYGQIYEGLQKSPGWLEQLARHRFLFPLWFLLLTTGLILFIFYLKRVKILITAITFTTLAAVLLPMIQIAYHSLNQSFQIAKGGFSLEDTTQNPNVSDSLPNVYLIVLDSYTRHDVMEEEFQVDNTEFLNELRDMGFTVAACSLSNYAHTNQSLTSVLFMDYLQNIFTGSDTYSWKNSPVIEKFHRLGYQVIAFDNGFSLLSTMPVDRLIKADENTSSNNLLFQPLNDFEVIIARSTVGLILFDLINTENHSQQPPLLQKITDLEVSKKERLYQQTISFFSVLEQTADINGPNFIYAHFMVPHDPYVFNAEGIFVNSPTSERVGYGQQVEYINHQLTNSLSRILKKSLIPPVVIVMGDHGPAAIEGLSKEEKMSILYAILLPGESDTEISSSISPVNTFRLVFNSLEDAKLPLLPNESYFTIEKHMKTIPAGSLLERDRITCNP